MENANELHVASEEEVRDKRINVRVSAREQTLLEQIAREQGVSASEFLRDYILSYDVDKQPERKASNGPELLVRLQKDLHSITSRLATLINVYGKEPIPTQKLAGMQRLIDEHIEALTRANADQKATLPPEMVSLEKETLNLIATKLKYLADGNVVISKHMDAFDGNLQRIRVCGSKARELTRVATETLSVVPV